MHTWWCLLTCRCRYRGYHYYTRTEEGQQYAVHCRRAVPPYAAPPGAADAPDEDQVEEVLLDENDRKEKGGHAFYMVGAAEVSPDQKLLAWSEDTEGGEKYTLHVKVSVCQSVSTHDAQLSVCSVHAAEPLQLCALAPAAAGADASGAGGAAAAAADSGGTAAVGRHSHTSLTHSHWLSTTSAHPIILLPTPYLICAGAGQWARADEAHHWHSWRCGMGQ